MSSSLYVFNPLEKSPIPIVSDVKKMLAVFILFVSFFVPFLCLRIAFCRHHPQIAQKSVRPLSQPYILNPENIKIPPTIPSPPSKKKWCYQTAGTERLPKNIHFSVNFLSSFNPSGSCTLNSDAFHWLEPIPHRFQGYPKSWASTNSILWYVRFLQSHTDWTITSFLQCVLNYEICLAYSFQNDVAYM